jgi:hypothetical protein
LRKPNLFLYSYLLKRTGIGAEVILQAPSLGDALGVRATRDSPVTTIVAGATSTNAKMSWMIVVNSGAFADVAAGPGLASKCQADAPAGSTFGVLVDSLCVALLVTYRCVAKRGASFTRFGRSAYIRVRAASQESVLLVATAGATAKAGILVSYWSRLGRAHDFSANFRSRKASQAGHCLDWGPAPVLEIDVPGILIVGPLDAFAFWVPGAVVTKSG